MEYGLNKGMWDTEHTWHIWHFKFQAKENSQTYIIKQSRAGSSALFSVLSRASMKKHHIPRYLQDG